MNTKDSVSMQVQEMVERGRDILAKKSRSPGCYGAEEIRATVSFLSSFLNEINRSEDADRDELLEFHLERALQMLKKQIAP